MKILVQESDFDPGAEIAALHTGRPKVGAVASFVGLEASVGSMTAADEYRQAALQKGDDAQRSFVATLVNQL
jgi:hypothetical protein